MSLYLSIIFFLLLIASFYKNRSSVSIRFLIGIFVGWMIAILSFVLYLSKHNYYWQEVNKLFYINRNLWNTIMTHITTRPDMLIRSINIGVLLLYYCAACFGIAFTSKESKKNNKKYMLLGIIPLIQLILLDPISQKSIQIHVVNKMGITFSTYNLWCKYTMNLFKILNLAYCTSMIIMLVAYYISHPKIKFLKTYTLFNIICLTPIIGGFYYIFRWWPQVLVKATVKTNYYTYLIPNLRIRMLNNQIYYLVFLIVFLAITLYIYKYNSMENYYRRDEANIKISMDTASLGVNAFTHAIKNHVQGIKSETEYLLKKHQNDEDTVISLGYILESCEHSFKSIEYANAQLKNVDLNLKLISLDQLVGACCEKFQNMHKEISIHYKPKKTDTMAYIDEERLREVVSNLISNAIEAVSGKENGMLNINIQERGNWGVVEIKDNGVGIKEEDLTKVFSPFFSTKSTINNWGVGLAFCYRVVEAHDGKLTVESKEGQGSVFSISLPIV